MKTQTWRAILAPLLVLVGGLFASAGIQGWSNVLDAEMLVFLGAMAVIGGLIQFGLFVHNRKIRRRLQELKHSSSQESGEFLLIKRVGSQIAALRSLVAHGHASHGDARSLDEVHLLRVGELGLTFANFVSSGDERLVVELPWSAVEAVETGTVHEAHNSYRGLILTVSSPQRDRGPITMPLLLWHSDGPVGGIASVGSLDSAKTLLIASRPFKG